MIDIHAHINDSDFNGDREEVIKGTLDAGVRIIIDSSIDYESGIVSLQLSKHYKGIIFTTIGMDSVLDEYVMVAELIKENRDRIVGVGEVGLDFFKVKDRRDRMIKQFKNFIKLANALDFPLVIHSRNAGRETIQILVEEKARSVVMHAFDGKTKDALLGIEQGFCFSFPPSTLHSTQKQQLAEIVPLENMLLESDSPVLGPERGKRNEPKNLILTLSKLSKIKQVSEKELEDITDANARKIFGV